jgi:hypothetical protein
MHLSGIEGGHGVKLKSTDTIVSAAMEYIHTACDHSRNTYALGLNMVCTARTRFGV